MKFKKKYIWILIDMFLYAAILIVFALFHHGMERVDDSNAVVVNEIVTNEVMDTIPILSEDKSNDAIDINENTIADTLPQESTYPNDLLQGKFQDKFTDGEIIVTDNQYISNNISITIDHIKLSGDTEDENITYHIADIYIRDINCFKTALAKDKYGRAVVDDFTTIAQDNNAILAITGDFYSVRTEGIVLRNGILHRYEPWGDILIMNTDGSMQVYSKDEFDIDEAIANGAYQGWSFGPILLKDGQIVTDYTFERSINGKNPRSAVGYYESGHYCYVAIDGRGRNGSSGMTFVEMSNLFSELGCLHAYNLDGGGSAKMFFDDRIINKPSNYSRGISDILYIIDIDDANGISPSTQENTN